MRARTLMILLAATIAIAFLGTASAGADPSIAVEPTSGITGTPLTVTGEGMTPGAEVSIMWGTMEGNRVSGSGYEPVKWPMGTTTVSPGGTMSFDLVVPDDLGGVIPHTISVEMDGETLAATPFTLERDMHISPTSGPEGTVVMFELKSGGWTQYDNIVAITYDNSFIGYACSFTNQGHIAVWFQAVGGVGPHIIGIYPSPWTGPSGWDPQSNPTPWKHPILNVDDMPTIYEPEFFTFEITESSRGSRSVLGGAVDIHEVNAGDSLAINPTPASPIVDGTPHVTVGNGGEGVVGGDLPYALAGFPANAHVVLRWDTRDGETSVGGEYGDKNLGWVFTETYAILGEVDVDGQGRASGALSIPHDFGGDHTLEALVDGEVMAATTFRVLQRFTASISEDGKEIVLHATGLGWEKYTAAWDVLYDAKLVGWVTALTSRGTVDFTIPVVGEPGMHTIEIHEGQNGFPFLNMHETSWPWTRVYRFAFTIEEPEGQVGGLKEGSSDPALPASVVIPVVVVAMMVVVIITALYWFGRRAPSEGKQPGIMKEAPRAHHRD